MTSFFSDLEDQLRAAAREHTSSGTGAPSPQKRAGRRSQVWWWTLHLRNYAIANGHRTRALREKAERFPERYMEGQPVEQRVFKAALHLLWRSRRLRRALLRFELRRYVEACHGDLFEPVLHGNQALGPALKALR